MKHINILLITILFSTHCMASMFENIKKNFVTDTVLTQALLKTAKKQTYPRSASSKINQNELVKRNTASAKSVEADNSDECSYYLKYPPMINSLILTEERNETIELQVKEEFSSYQIEMKLWIYDDYGIQYNEYTYLMHDDGTMGDKIAGDHIYTNDQILLTYSKTSSYKLKFIILYTNFLKNGDIVHTDRNKMYFINVNKNFLNGLTIPDIKYMGCSGDIMWSPNFIYTIKNENWKEMQKQNICELDHNYVQSQELLYNYWDKNEIFNNQDDLTYCQIDFSEPWGQFSYPDGNAIYLEAGSIFGPIVHELLHRWVPDINYYLGLLYSDSYDGHHPNIFRNTSGFLYSTWDRLNGIYFKDQINNIVKVNDSIQYVYSEKGVLWNEEVRKQQQFNDYEMYLMGLVPVDSVDFPINFFKNHYKREWVIDSISGFLIGVKDYFKELVEVNQQQLIEAKAQMLSELSWRTNLDGKIIKLLPVFTGSHLLSVDEIKMMNLLAEEIATKTETKMDNTNTIFQTYYQATKGKGQIELFVPEPITQNFTPTSIEQVEICEGESYQNWNTSGEYIRKLETTTGCDSIVTTNLTVNPSYSKTENITICFGESYKDWKETGQYEEKLTSITGCDSIVTTNVTVLNAIETLEDISICEGIDYFGWTKTGEYTRKLQAITGCDSIVVTNLTVNPSYSKTENITICFGESYKDWKETGQYEEKLTSITGCDSIVTTILTIDKVDKPTITKTENTLISSAEKGNQWYLEQNPITDAIKQTYTINQSGNYAVQASNEKGCVSEISESVNVWLTLVNNIRSQIQIYPNPTTGLLQIDGLPQNEKTVITIYNVTGQKIEQKEIVKSKATIDLSHYNKGPYYLSFNNSFYGAIKIIKE